MVALALDTLSGRPLVVAASGLGSQKPGFRNWTAGQAAAAVQVAGQAGGVGSSSDPWRPCQELPHHPPGGHTCTGASSYSLDHCNTISSLF